MLSPLLGAHADVPDAWSSEQSERPVGGAATLASTLASAAADDVAQRWERAQLKDQVYGIVYQYNVWGSDVSRSGTGSDLWSPEARLAVTALEAVVSSFNVRSILDAACGDATWMVPYFVSKHPEIAYVGVDAVSSVVEKNRQRHPGLQFLTIDLAGTPLPAGADLVFSKETLNHMHLSDAMMALRRFAASKARYLLTNVHEGADNDEGNRKTCHTTYIKYDYELPPFSLKKVATITEYQGPRTSYSLFALQ